MPANYLPDGIPETNRFADARAALAEYLDWVKSLLEEIVNENGDELLVDDLRGLAQEAWTDVSTRIDEVIDSLTALAGDTLREHGLFGPQLRFKLKAVRIWFERWRNGDCSLTDLLARVNDLLDSIPGGGAIREYKDAVSASLR